MTRTSTTGRRQSSVERAIRELRALSHQRGPEAKLPTYRDLCATLDVSSAVLDTALEALEAQNVITRRQGSGIYVSADLNRRQIALVMDGTFLDNPSPFWGLLHGKFIACCHARAQRSVEDYQIFVSLPNAAGEAILPPNLTRLLQEGAVHGLIGVGTSFRDPRMEWPSPQGSAVPTVAIFGSGDWEIGLGWDAVVAKGVPALAARGCRRIGYWSPVFSWNTSPDGASYHHEEFRRSLAACGLTYDPALCWGPSGSDAGYTQEMGAALARKALEASPLPDGVVIADDLLTQGALAAMRQLGVEPGRDIQIATHANAGSPVLYGYEDRLIRVELDPALMAQAALEAMDRILSGDPPAERKITVPMTLRD